MKKILCSATLFFAVLSLISCSSDSSSSSSPTSGVNQDQINGWWYPGPDDLTTRYKGYYFAVDGEFRQDMSNFGLGIGQGTWLWETAVNIKMTPDAGGGIVGGPVTIELTKLTSDSLVGNVGSISLKLGRTLHN